MSALNQYSTLISEKLAALPLAPNGQTVFERGTLLIFSPQADPEANQISLGFRRILRAAEKTYGKQVQLFPIDDRAAILEIPRVSDSWVNQGYAFLHILTEIEVQQEPGIPWIVALSDTHEGYLRPSLWTRIQELTLIAADRKRPLLCIA
ncbi:MAG: hypothetical protein AAFV07_04595 [Bacteroidota bacterium]